VWDGDAAVEGCPTALIYSRSKPTVWDGDAHHLH